MARNYQEDFAVLSTECGELIVERERLKEWQTKALQLLEEATVLIGMCSSVKREDANKEWIKKWEDFVSESF